MMPKKKTGGPAFPANIKNDLGDHFQSYEGMSLRDWFAGQALAVVADRIDTENRDLKRYANFCYELADAMIEAGTR